MKLKISEIIKNSVLRKLLLTGYSFIIALLIFCYLICTYFEMPFEWLTSDTAAVASVNPFIGSISNLGILLWCSTVAICFFTLIIKKIKKQNSGLSFILFSGMLTLGLLFDDLFMLHEYILPEKLHIPQNMVYAIYIILIISYFYLFRKSILKNNYPILILACLFLGISVSIDIVFPSHGFEYLIEDGFKILGIFSWMLFYASVCARFLLPENNSIRKINNTISQ